VTPPRVAADAGAVPVVPALARVDADAVADAAAAEAEAAGEAALSSACRTMAAIMFALKVAAAATLEGRKPFAEEGAGTEEVGNGRMGPLRAAADP